MRDSGRKLQTQRTFGTKMSGEGERAATILRGGTPRRKGIRPPVLGGELGRKVTICSSRTPIVGGWPRKQPPLRGLGTGKKRAFPSSRTTISCCSPAGRDRTPGQSAACARELRGRGGDDTEVGRGPGTNARPRVQAKGARQRPWGAGIIARPTLEPAGGRFCRARGAESEARTEASGGASRSKCFTRRHLTRNQSAGAISQEENGSRFNHGSEALHPRGRPDSRSTYSLEVARPSPGRMY